MSRQSRHLLVVGATLAALLPLLAGCAAVARTGATPTTGALPVTQVATAPAPATSTPPAPPAATATSRTPAHARGLSAGDAKAIDAELGAIQGELDRLNAPSDSDLDAIGSGLK